MNVREECLILAEAFVDRGTMTAMMPTTATTVCWLADRSQRTEQQQKQSNDEGTVLRILFIG
jgi:hypothetical protein